MADAGESDASAVRIEREGARVLLLDDSGRLLVLRGHDPHEPTRSWWFTPGGGIERGEDQRGAAVRELAEETGLVLERHELVGPVWRRTALFDFFSRQYVQREVFFVGRLADAERRGRVRAAWTDDEQDVIDDTAWMTRSELAAADIEVFPRELRMDWSPFLEWDGETIDLGVANE